MARKLPEQVSIAEQMLRDIAAPREGPLSFDERLELLGRVRESNIESAANIDRFLLDRLFQLDSALSSVEEEQGKLHEVVASLTAPPFFPTVYLGKTCMNGVDFAIVQSGEDVTVITYGTMVFVALAAAAAGWCVRNCS